LDIVKLQIQHCSVYRKSIDILVENFASVFKVEEGSKVETSMKQAAGKFLHECDFDLLSLPNNQTLPH
jgi:hypothetical protein